MKEYFKIGKLVASHGLKGDLILVHSLGKKTDFKDLETIFIEEGKERFLPYFIQSTTVRSDTETLLKLEGFESKESVKKLYPREVWLQEEDFNKYVAENSPIALLGYTMIHGEQNLGEIVEVIEQPHQVLCSIIYNGKEALIPIHEQSLVKVDQSARKVFVDLPDGLLEIYE